MICCWRQFISASIKSHSESVFITSSSDLLLMEFMLLLVLPAGSLCRFLRHNVLVLLFVVSSKRRGRIHLKCFIYAYRFFTSAKLHCTKHYTVLCLKWTTSKIQGQSIFHVCFVPFLKHNAIQGWQKPQWWCWKVFRYPSDTVTWETSTVLPQPNWLVWFHTVFW